MEDRRREVQAYRFTSPVGLLGSFPLTAKLHYNHKDIRNFLNSRHVAWTEDEFEAIIEQISSASAQNIHTHELASFLGLSEESKPPHIAPTVYEKDEMLDIQIIRLFEQTISCHRKI
jgi:hypothetical protein